MIFRPLAPPSRQTHMLKAANETSRKFRNFREVDRTHDARCIPFSIRLGLILCGQQCDQCGECTWVGLGSGTNSG
jgi:hypothetical protein